MEIKSCTMKAPACIYTVHVVWFGLAKTISVYKLHVTGTLFQ